MTEPAAERLISLEEFSKVRLKIGRVLQAENIAGMNKVFKVKVDLGNEHRELAVGGAAFYQPEEFLGKMVVVCTNLEPKKIGSIVSRGMLLAADGPRGKPIFLTASEDAAAGSLIH